MSEVVIAGRGLAALTCALLLARQGRRVRITGTEVTGTRWLVLPEAVAGLLCEVWSAGGGVLDTAWTVDRRCVRWGDTAREQVAARSRALDGTTLNQRLAAHLSLHYGDQIHFDDIPVPYESAPDARWLITSAPSPRFGTVGRRRIIAAEAALIPSCDSSTCRLETTSQGWVHLAPVGKETALVQAMVPGPVQNPLRHLRGLLDETGLGAWLAEPPVHASVVRAAPGLLTPPCGPGWLAVGAAAVRFDPLSGSGTAHAVRTAILAAAAIDAIDRGHLAQDVLEHYATRIHTAFTDHLRSCLRLYRAAFPSAAWRDEIDITNVALKGSACESPRMNFMLSGSSLQRQR
ncbi:MAG: hypothetical protein ACT4NP_08210 [Pseudonocardiales bacterium]